MSKVLDAPQIWALPGAHFLRLRNSARPARESLVITLGPDQGCRIRLKDLLGSCALRHTAANAYQ